MVDNRRVYTAEETARILGICRNRVYEALKRGELPLLRIGSRMLVPRDQLDRMLSGDAPVALVHRQSAEGSS
ncbi:MAG: helix-turn-helix domain-containing protein [Reyranellaceae bacterium]